jgi:flagellar assembly protein FliH
MSSRVIPKEQLTAYQRWELAAVEDLARLQAETAGQGGGKGPNGLALPTAEEIERIHQEAWEEGRELGLKEGREAGYQEGLKAGQEHVRRLASFLEALDVARMRQEEAIAREVLNLALAVSRQILHASVAVKEGLVLAAIREAFASLPSLSGHLRVIVNPADADDVRNWLGAEHGHVPCKVHEDPAMERGGFRFENDSSILQGEMSMRWREVVSCLGADQDWLE